MLENYGKDRETAKVPTKGVCLELEGMGDADRTPLYLTRSPYCDVRKPCCRHDCECCKHSFADIQADPLDFLLRTGTGSGGDSASVRDGAVISSSAVNNADEECSGHFSYDLHWGRAGNDFGYHPAQLFLDKDRSRQEQLMKTRKLIQRSALNYKYDVEAFKDYGISPMATSCITAMHIPVSISKLTAVEGHEMLPSFCERFTGSLASTGKDVCEQGNVLGLQRRRASACFKQNGNKEDIYAIMGQGSEDEEEGNEQHCEVRHSFEVIPVGHVAALTSKLERRLQKKNLRKAAQRAVFEHPVGIASQNCVGKARQVPTSNSTTLSAFKEDLHFCYSTRTTQRRRYEISNRCPSPFTTHAARVAARCQRNFRIGCVDNMSYRMRQEAPRQDFSVVDLASQHEAQTEQMKLETDIYASSSETCLHNNSFQGFVYDTNRRNSILSIFTNLSDHVDGKIRLNCVQGQADQQDVSEAHINAWEDYFNGQCHVDAFKTERKQLVMGPSDDDVVNCWPGKTNTDLEKGESNQLCGKNFDITLASVSKTANKGKFCSESNRWPAFLECGPNFDLSCGTQKALVRLHKVHCEDTDDLENTGPTANKHTSNRKLTRAKSAKLLRGRVPPLDLAKIRAARDAAHPPIHIESVAHIKPSEVSSAWTSPARPSRFTRRLFPPSLPRSQAFSCLQCRPQNKQKSTSKTAADDEAHLLHTLSQISVTEGCVQRPVMTECKYPKKISQRPVRGRLRNCARVVRCNANLYTARVCVLLNKHLEGERKLRKRRLSLKRLLSQMDARVTYNVLSDVRRLENQYKIETFLNKSRSEVSAWRNAKFQCRSFKSRKLSSPCKRFPSSNVRTPPSAFLSSTSPFSYYVQSTLFLHRRLKTAAGMIAKTILDLLPNRSISQQNKVASDHSLFPIISVCKSASKSTRKPNQCTRLDAERNMRRLQPGAFACGINNRCHAAPEARIGNLFSNFLIKMDKAPASTIYNENEKCASGQPTKRKALVDPVLSYFKRQLAVDKAKCNFPYSTHSERYVACEVALKGKRLHIAEDVKNLKCEYSTFNHCRHTRTESQEKRTLDDDGSCDAAKAPEWSHRMTRTRRGRSPSDRQYCASIRANLTTRLNSKRKCSEVSVKYDSARRQTWTFPEAVLPWTHKYVQTRANLSANASRLANDAHQSSTMSVSNTAHNKVCGLSIDKAVFLRKRRLVLSTAKVGKVECARMPAGTFPIVEHFRGAEFLFPQRCAARVKTHKDLNSTRQGESDGHEISLYNVSSACQLKKVSSKISGASHSQEPYREGHAGLAEVLRYTAQYEQPQRICTEQKKDSGLQSLAPNLSLMSSNDHVETKANMLSKHEPCAGSRPGAAAAESESEHGLLGVEPSETEEVCESQRQSIEGRRIEVPTSETPSASDFFQYRGGMDVFSATQNRFIDSQHHINVSDRRKSEAISTIFSNKSESDELLEYLPPASGREEWKTLYWKCKESLASEHDNCGGPMSCGIKCKHSFSFKTAKKRFDSADSFFNGKSCDSLSICKSPGISSVLSTVASEHVRSTEPHMSH